MLDIDLRTLLERARQNDPEAWTALVERHHAYVYRTALGLVRDAELARDVTQDVFVVLVRRLSSFRFESAFSTFLYRITRNTALNALEKGAVRSRRSAGSLEQLADIGIVPIGAETADGRLLADERRQHVLRALSSLDGIFRDVLVARYVGDMAYDEIARALDIPLNTVRTRLARGLAHLRRALTEENADEA